MPDVLPDVLVWFFQTVWSLFGTPFTLYGFTFSFRQVFVYSFVISFVLWGFARYLDL